MTAKFLGSLTLLAGLFASATSSRLDNLIRSHLNNALWNGDGYVDKLGMTNGVWLDCDYYSIESNYFEQVNSNTFKLMAGSDFCHKCILLIDASNCSAYHAAVTDIIPNNCRDVQVVIESPDSVNISSELSQAVQEKVILEKLNQTGIEKYIAWVNVSSFTPHHQGEYRILFQTLPPTHTLYQHRFNLEYIDISFVKNSVHELADSNSSEFHYPKWLMGGFLTLGLTVICFSIYLFVFKPICKTERFA